jgi:hypothetical protein
MDDILEVNTLEVGILEVDIKPHRPSFSGSLSMYAQICDKSVLKRLLKELWKIVIGSLERNIVLPPVADRTVSSLRPIFNNMVCPQG